MLAYLELGERRRMLGDAVESNGGVAFHPIAMRHRREPGRLIELVEEADAHERAVLRAFPEAREPFSARVRLTRFERLAHDMPVVYLDRVVEAEPEPVPA